METAALTAAFEKYPAYKDSGEIWLPKIPLHWDMKKGKLLFNKEERPARDEDEIVTCFRDGQVTLRANRRTEGFTTALKEHGYQGIRKGDLVIHAMDAFAGAIGVSDSDGKSTPVYSVCTPKNAGQVNQFFYAYFLRNMATTNIILALAKGIRERSTDFRFKDFGELKIAFPPLPEQTAIAQFLDDKTAKIDRAIAQKEKLITLLKERKQIIIQDLVTGKKVWNPAQNTFTAPTRVKPSGVEWIGEIPEGWEVKRIKNIINRISNGTTAEQLQHPDENDSSIVRVTRIESISQEVINYNKVGWVRKSSISESFKLKKGDILFSHINSLEMVGKTALYNGDIDLYSGMNLLRITPMKSINYEWLHFYFKSKLSRNYFTSMAKPSINQASLPTTTILNYKIVYPTKEEQDSIVMHIKTQSAKIDKAIKLQEQQIEKLKELKSTLIDSAVTGKIKVS